MHLLVTDSGLGGLGICAAIDRAMRAAGLGSRVRLTYFNAWPEEGVGYNSMPDVAARVSYFDRALDRMALEHPDRIVIACNTLSVLFGQTAFASHPRVPVVGIIDTGLEMFRRALASDGASNIALFGTRITIESGVHRNGLVARGVAAERIAAAGCHGLAGAIEKDVTGPDIDRLIAEGVAQIAFPPTRSGPVFAGMCCTHFGYVAERFRSALARRVDRPVAVLDPNQGLADRVVRDLPASGTVSPRGDAGISVISKVRLDDRSRAGIAGLIADTSPAAVTALHDYRHVPDLF